MTVIEYVKMALRVILCLPFFIVIMIAFLVSYFFAKRRNRSIENFDQYVSEFEAKNKGSLINSYPLAISLGVVFYIIIAAIWF
jgi:hypothetical protein